MQRNRLAAETSPYLQQHAGNPVDWHPWNEEALSRAEREKKPILLSIGYSACHWCHVMAHESFEDPATAALMNELFVNIKVDREERPDLDKIYQAAQQLLTHSSGGWPLTMFLTPQGQVPFFGGTYFPKTARHGMPAFPDLLRRVADYHRDHGKEILEQNEQLKLALQGMTAPGAPPGAALDQAPLKAGRDALERSFDAEFGGFGRAPKFPQAAAIERCFKYWCAASAGSGPDLKALFMASLTLTRMAEGGLYDQLGGGFSRYSVDDAWMIPHFEKMLYDNGPLLALYAQAALATGESLFARIAAETAEWALREMRTAQGAFYSSLDADSEGREGQFYLWTPPEVRALLTPAEYAALSRRFGLDGAANFDGQWHLRVHESIDAIAALLGQPPQSIAALIDSGRAKLLSARTLRVWPARDGKTLTAWNALMIKGLAIAARALNRPDLADAAVAGIDFLRRHLWRTGRLLAAHKDGRAHLPAYLDDYVFMVDALIELLQTRWRSQDLEFARLLTEVLLDQFEDPAAGGFFFTATEHERLVHRIKTYSDDSMSSGNAIAASALCRLGYLLGEVRYVDAAERTLRASWRMLAENPQAHMSMLNSLEDFLLPAHILIIRGEAAEAARWAAQLGVVYAPRRMIFSVPNDAEDLPASIAAKSAGAETLAYGCTGMTCSAPMNHLSEITRWFARRP